MFIFSHLLSLLYNISKFVNYTKYILAFRGRGGGRGRGGFRGRGRGGFRRYDEGPPASVIGMYLLALALCYVVLCYVILF